MSKKKKIWIGVGIVAIIVIMAIIFILKGRGDTTVDGEFNPEDMEIQVQKVGEQQLEETILVTGQIVADGEQKVYADPESGEIKEFKVDENAKVKAGDPLFVYDGSKIEAEFNAAVRARDMSQNGVLRVQNQINQLTKQIDEMKRQQGVPVDPEDEESGFVVSAGEIRESEIEKNQLAIELENAKAEVAAAQDEVNAIEKRKQDLTVKSKMDGTVVKVNKNQERTEEGAAEAVVHIVSDAPFKVVGTMSEYDSVKIKPEQSVVIRPKVFKEKEWKGTVESVSQFPTDEGGDMDMYGGGDTNVTMYPFKVAITDDTKDLRQGFHVSLEVNVGGTEKKLVVPHMAILDEMMMMGMDDEEGGMMDDFFMTEGGSMEDDAQFVFVLVDGVLERRDIETGKMSDEFVEIISGVELGELVVINPMPEFYDGMEVTTYDEVD